MHIAFIRSEQKYQLDFSTNRKTLNIYGHTLKSSEEHDAKIPIQEQE